MFTNFTLLHVLHLTLAFSGLSRAATILPRGSATGSGVSQVIAPAPVENERSIASWRGELPNGCFWAKLVEEERCTSTMEIYHKAAVVGFHKHRAVLITSPGLENDQRAIDFAESRALVRVTVDEVFPDLHSTKQLQNICQTTEGVDFLLLLFKAMLEAITARHVFVFDAEQGSSAALATVEKFRGCGGTSVYEVTPDEHSGVDVHLLLVDSSSWPMYIKNRRCPSINEIASVSAIGPVWMRSVLIIAPGATDWDRVHEFAGDKKLALVRLRDAFWDYSNFSGDLIEICKARSVNIKFRMFEAMVQSISVTEKVFVHDTKPGQKNKAVDVVVNRFLQPGDQRGRVASVSWNPRHTAIIRNHERKEDDHGTTNT